MSTVEYPGARRADRLRTVDSHGLRLAVHEWGDPEAAPILLAHGGFDFAGTFDVFAPILAEAGWRVVAWDQRGHGDSDHAVIYNWDADVRDGLSVLDSISQHPIPVLGHSKGGSVVTQLADALPHRVSKLVNLDGLPSRRNWPDVADHDRARLLKGEIASWLQHHRTAGDKVRRAGTLDELAERRKNMNPRLPIDWLRYLVTVGARQDGAADDGWRWKLDPALRFGGFGPFRPEWSMMRMPGLSMPLLGVLGLAPDPPMAWGTQPEDVLPWLPPGGRFVPLEGVGHFVHIEQPELVSSLVLEFLGRPPRAPAGGWAAGVVETRPAPRPATVPAGGEVEPHLVVRHVKSELAIHRLRDGEPDHHPLLVLHGLGEPRPAEPPAWTDAWPGAVLWLDFTGHGSSTIPVGGGYSAEFLLGDADNAVAALGTVTVAGRGLGAYVALLLAGARPEVVRGTILLDGPGMIGKSSGPGASYPAMIDTAAAAVPDPFALAELSRDIRTPDYAAVFARMALLGSDLEHPIAVCTVNRPPWLAAVVDEPGVLDISLDEAVSCYRS